VWIDVVVCGGRAALLRWLSDAVLKCCSGGAVGAVFFVTCCEVGSVAVCSSERQRAWASQTFLRFLRLCVD
jgi:hypothetical protein